jgi:hypothetical protein
MTFSRTALAALRARGVFIVAERDNGFLVEVAGRPATMSYHDLLAIVYT